MTDISHIKKIIKLAKNSGIRALSVDGISLEFRPDITQRKRTPRLIKQDDDIPVIPKERIPTLDEINNYIYLKDETE